MSLLKEQLYFGKDGQNFKRSLERYAKYVTDTAKKNLQTKGIKASGELSRSISYKLKGNKVQFFSEEYGQYVDLGVRGTKKSYPQTIQAQDKAGEHFKFKSGPPSSVFLKWIKLKGIKGRDKKTGRFITNKSLSFLISRSLNSKGIRASLFFTKPFEDAFRLFSDEIAISYIKDKTGQ